MVYCLIDGDGYFILTKKGYASCEITIDIRDKQALYLCKKKFEERLNLFQMLMFHKLHYQKV